jgi:hypothetical protein
MIACIAAGFGCLFAQDTRTVKGVVISSEDNLPVIGAAVMEKGTKNATMTDIDGKFTLKVRLSAKTLEISCLGMKPKDVGITDGEMRISLEADTEVLEGVRDWYAEDGQAPVHRSHQQAERRGCQTGRCG